MPSIFSGSPGKELPPAAAGLTVGPPGAAWIAYGAGQRQPGPLVEGRDPGSASRTRARKDVCPLSLNERLRTPQQPPSAITPQGKKFFDRVSAELPAWNIFLRRSAGKRPERSRSGRSERNWLAHQGSLWPSQRHTNRSRPGAAFRFPVPKTGPSRAVHGQIVRAVHAEGDEREHGIGGICP